MAMSRFRRPTSKSTTAVRWPRAARPTAKAALDVVFPTPPLPEVITIILATFLSFRHFALSRWSLSAGYRPAIEPVRNAPAPLRQSLHLPGDGRRWKATLPPAADKKCARKYRLTRRPGPGHARAHKHECCHQPAIPPQH